jgi:predicted Zn-dependent protease
LARSEDELAAILAHEMAHVVRGHGVRVIKKARKMKVYKIMASEASAGVFGDYNAAAQFLTQAVSDIVGTMVTSGYSRKLEHEADWRAVRILWSAGYDPTALHRVLSVMSQLRVGSDAGFFSTHPPPSARMSYLRKILPKSHPPVPQVRVARFRAASLPVNQGQS